MSPFIAPFSEKDVKRVLEDAVKTFGIEPQRDMLIEECSELIKAILKIRREEQYLKRLKMPVMVPSLKITPLRESLVEEIADVQLMLEQVILMDLSEKEREMLEFKRAQKLARLQVRINQYQIKEKLMQGEKISR